GGAAAEVGGGNVPGAVDAAAGERLPDVAPPVQHDQAAGPGHAATLGGQRADDHPAATQHGQRGSQAHPAGAAAQVRADLGEQRDVAVRGDLHDGGAGTLHVGLVVEVADQDVVPLQVTGAPRDDGHAVGV